MMSFGKEAILLSVFFAAVVLADPILRLIGGEDVDSLRQFPHHVNIVPYKSNRNCGGSILNAQWILTSAACVKDSVRLEIEFKKDKRNDPSSGFYSISVNDDQIFVYPTEHDDIALIRIPIRLVFSNTIAQIKISNLSLTELRNRFVVMPGFTDRVVRTYTPPLTATQTHGPILILANAILPTQIPENTTAPTQIPEDTTLPTQYPANTTAPTQIPENTTKPVTTPYVNPTTQTTPDTTTHTTTMSTTPEPVADNLKYGKFEVLDSSVCKEAYGHGIFNEYTQLCIRSFGNSGHTPCDSDFGSGLIVEWPAKSELIGVFSMFSSSCDSRRPSIFTYAPKYLPWIQSMIQI